MFALDPADRRKMVPLVTRNPAIAMPPVEPNSRRDTRPVPPGCSSVPRPVSTMSALLLSDLWQPGSEARPESKGSSFASVVELRGSGKAICLRQAERGGCKAGPHKMRALCQDGRRTAGFGKRCSLIAAGHPRALRFPAGAIRCALEKCALPLHVCQAGNGRSQSGSFHHIGHGGMFAARSGLRPT